jgi:hypothetical protein
VATAEELAIGNNITNKVPTDGDFPAGELVGHVETIQEAMSWVKRYAFADSPSGAVADANALEERDAPLPGGGLLSDHRVLLLDLIVTGGTPEGGTRTIRWPTDQSEVLPTGSSWSPAALIPQRAPLFAAPDDVLPVSIERYSIAKRSGGLYLLDTVDRCHGRDTAQRCLRWARVVVREGDRFRGGYLPNHQVARIDGWTRADGAALPRAQLIASHTGSGHAHFVLVVRARDNELHRRSITAPLVQGGFPSTRVRVTATTAKIVIDGQPPLVVPIEPTMDLYARPQ